MEETINLALDDATNGDILLMVQNEELKQKNMAVRKTMAIVVR